VPAAMRAAP